MWRVLPVNAFARYQFAIAEKWIGMMNGRPRFETLVRHSRTAAGSAIVAGTPA
jgi:hypothetical protein